MEASRLVVFWQNIMLSSPVWFLVEVVAKKPWRWSLCSSMALAGFLPIFTLIAFTFGSVLSGFIVLFIVECGLLTLAIASLLSSVAVLVPAALVLTLFIYVIYKSIAMAVCAVCWVLALPKATLRRIKQEVARVCTCVSGIASKLCFWRNLNRKRRKDKNSDVRWRATHRISHRNSATGRGTNNPRERRNERSCRTRDSNSRKSRGWCKWFSGLFHTESDSRNSASDRSLRTCRHGYEIYLSRSGTYYELACEVCTRKWSASTGSSSGCGSDSFHTADEWLVEDDNGDIIPDYRDHESKMYEALLKRDICTGGYSYF
ncbi:hypothetical protein OS493_034834 [Desmophyllum pertusum]|uniref:Uncharacterized protein n=1 Tax=Desmophyllum pertusum TaxID=174260 RepID=A0A9W9Y7V0_9CNID|nr:hypothetical protein OS493_034834 [Desmophyllum pertusum]